MLENEKLYVIAVVSNPVRYASRYALFLKFKEYMKRFPQVELVTVEISFGERKQFITGEETLKNIQLSSFEELWHKENMINAGLINLPNDWKYVAWIDADVHFVRDDWALETLHQLQHYMFVQMFQDAIDLGPSQESLKIHRGFLASYHKGLAYKTGYHDWHPGFAWAARREAIDAVGGLIDYAILGSADRHMACAMIGRADQSFSANLTEGYKRKVMRWQELCTRHIKRDVGFVPGTLLHDWHGKKVNRQYGSRWTILERNQFDPDADLKLDSQGLWQLEVSSERQIQLRDDIRAYFRARAEDSTDVV